MKDCKKEAKVPNQWQDTLDNVEAHENWDKGGCPGPARWTPGGEVTHGRQSFLSGG